MKEPIIIFEDSDLVVIDKPSGLAVHAAPHTPHEGTLAEWIMLHVPSAAEVGEPKGNKSDLFPLRPGIVHRLDRDTSGVMVIAKTQSAYENLKEQFLVHEIRKVYRAFVYGLILDDRGIIDKPIGRGKGSGSHRSVHTTGGTLREAQTAFRTIARGGALTGKEDTRASYLEVFPKTGRTHQIRVHLSSIHHPVICDQLYAQKHPSLLGFERLALHALSLSFTHPATGKEVTFSAPLPGDFVRAELDIQK